MRQKIRLRIGVIIILVVVIAISGKIWLSNNHNISEPKPVSTTKKPNNEFSHVSYYQDKLLDRYQAYQLITSNLSIEDIVTHVNMGIDIGFYQQDPIIIKKPDAIDVLVNKFYKLPENWKPATLVLVNEAREQFLESRAADAFFEFQEACEQEGFLITAYSGYRSTAYQSKIYNNMIASYGEEETDKYVSRPGQSEHTTGLCVDISIDGIYYEDIESSPYYPWFREHLSEYGFILRYPENKESLTGYHYESWHIRYLGKDLAKKVEASGLTYDEYVARQ